jgi:hypothetical protein
VSVEPKPNHDAPVENCENSGNSENSDPAPDAPPNEGKSDDPPPRDDDDYSSGEQPRGAAATHYVYKDARGFLYMRVTRTNGKSFPTQHWHDGRWLSGWPAIVIPYRLPELLAAPAIRFGFARAKRMPTMSPRSA